MTNTTHFDKMLVNAAQDGRANELACGLMSMSLLAAALFLADVVAEDGSVPKEEQNRLAEAVMLVKAKAIQFGVIAAAKLCADAPKETQDAFSGALGSAIVALVALEETARACGGNPDAARGMMLMATQGILKDLRACTTGGGQ